MKRVFFILVVFLLTIDISSAQRWKLKRWEAYAGIGTVHLFGDIGGSPEASNLLFIKDFQFKTTRPSINGGIRFKINNRFSAKLSILYGFANLTDDGARNPERDFSSTTHLLETSAQVEYYFIPEERRFRSAAMFNRRGMINNYSTISAYVFGGMGMTKYWVNVSVPEPRPGDSYEFSGKFIPSFPLGIGAKYVISDKWLLFYEVGGRYTFHDLIDGVSTQYSNHNDVYWFSSLSMSYRIKTSRRGLPVFIDRYWQRVQRMRRRR